METYLFENDLLQTPVLQLRTPTWLAMVPRKFRLSGHFVIGYPIVVDGWPHDDRVWLTKVTALLMAVSGIIFVAGLFSRFLRRRSD